MAIPGGFALSLSLAIWLNFISLLLPTAGHAPAPRATNAAAITFQFIISADIDSDVAAA